jgi:hypothetical protein
MWVKGFKLVGFKMSKLINLFILNISLHSIVLMNSRISFQEKKDLLKYLKVFLLKIDYILE